MRFLCTRRFVESFGVCDFRVWEHDTWSLIGRELEQTFSWFWFFCFLCSASWSLKLFIDDTPMTHRLISGCQELCTIFLYGCLWFDYCVPKLRKGVALFLCVLLWCQARALASVHYIYIHFPIVLWQFFGQCFWSLVAVFWIGFVLVLGGMT